MHNIKEISSLRGTAWETYAVMSEPQLLHCYEPETGIFIAESPNVIARALHAGYQPISFLIAREQMCTSLQDMLSDYADIPLYLADAAAVAELRGWQMTRGMLCVMRRRELPTVQSICANARRIAVLENVMNPTNLGAIFRSAAALGIDGILLSGGCTDPFYRRAARVSMGTVFQIPWTYLPAAPNAAQGIRDLRAAGFHTAAMALCDDSIGLDDPALNAADRLAMVFGTEGEGLATETIAACNDTVKIPMSHGVDSLNVAAASAVVFWQLCRAGR